MKCSIVSGIHLPKYLRLSRTPSQWYGALGSGSGTSPSHPRNRNNLCALSLGFSFPAGPIATSLVAGASTLQCRSRLAPIFPVASWRSITRARYHSSPSFADFFHRISLKVSRYREPPYASSSTKELGFNNMSARQLRVRKSSTKTVETSVHVLENGAESTKKGPKPRSTLKKDVRKLRKDDFEIGSWQYQLMERQEDNNLSTYTTVELRELLREMKQTSKGQKADMLKVVKKWLNDNGCGTASVLDEDQSLGNEEKSLDSLDTKAGNTSPETKVETTTPGRGKRKRQAPNEEIDIVKAVAGADKPLPKAKSTKKSLKPSTAKESESKDAVLQTSSQPGENKEAWTLLVHKKPQPEWVAYNPATMRPELPSGNEKVMKIISWNVNGLRALLKEKGMSQEQGSLIARLAAREDFDVLCLQETKLQEKDVDQIQESLLASHESSLWSCSTSKLGYSGTAVISRIKPLSVQYGFGTADHDLEGRLITCEFDSFYLVVSYVPNAGAKLERLEYRTQSWDPALCKFMKELEKKKPVILTGDLNVANEEIDIHHPAGNIKSAGFTEEERASFKANFLEQGFVDSFRKQHPNAVSYTYWGYRTAARPKNQGWRLDYFLLSESLADSVHDSYTIPDVGGSDHCPIGLILKV